MGKNFDLARCSRLNLDFDQQFNEDQPFLALKEFDVFRELQQIGAFADCIDAIRTKKYEVLIPDAIKKQLTEGKLEWDNNGDSFAATIRDVDTGRFVKQIRVRELPGNFVEVLKRSEQQELLNNINSKLLAIENGIKTIIKGQQDDRLALMESGREMLRQSEEVFRPELKSHLQALGISQIEECRQKILKEIEELLRIFIGDSQIKGKLASLISPLTDDKLKKAEEFLKLCERLVSSSVLIYSFYHHHREFYAARASLKPFERFAEKLKVIGKTIERHLPYNVQRPTDDLFDKQIPALLKKLSEDVPILLDYQGGEK